jgi:cysteine desulfurase/selenocysteine lyase
VDVAAICAGALAYRVPVLVDGSQAAVHMPINVQQIGCDFYAVTGHELYGHSGTGAIYVHQGRMAEMRPCMGGGDMLREVTRDTVIYNNPPRKFKAGTPGTLQTICLGVSLNYMIGLGMANIAAHEITTARLRPQAS